MSTCILNLATGPEKYRVGQKRLVESLRRFFRGGDIFAFQNEADVLAPPHSVVPYGFKPYAFLWAKQRGFDVVLWLDASVVAVAPLGELFHELKQRGHLMQQAGHHVGRWANKYCLSYFGLTRQQVAKWLMYGDSGLLGLDFRCPRSRVFLSRWKAAADSGAFNGSWEDHRHDMTCGSIIAHRLEMEYTEPGKYLRYGMQNRHRGDYTCLIAVGV